MFDTKQFGKRIIEEKRTSGAELQERQIADYIMRQPGGAMSEEGIGLMVCSIAVFMTLT